MVESPTRPHSPCWNGRLIVSGVVGLLFTAACLVPAVRVARQGTFSGRQVVQDHFGLQALAFGWVSPEFLLPWSANVALGVGGLLLLCGKYGLSTGAGALATGLGATAWGCLVPEDAVRPSQQAVLRLYAGYYLWQVSHLSLLVGAGVLAIGCRRCRPADRHAAPGRRLTRDL